jgi:hypothetical protein
MQMKLKLKICAAALATTMISSVNAGVVTQWSYTNQAGFTEWSGESTPTYATDEVSASGNSATGDNSALTSNAGNILDTNGDFVVDGTDLALHTSLTWGVPANLSTDPRSSLNIDSPVAGAMTTNDSSWSNGTDIIHENWVIVGDSLESATVFDGLALIPTAWDAFGDDDADLLANAPYFAPQLQFGVNFFETPNGSATGTCPDGTAHGQGDNINGCGDIFELTGLELLPIAPVVGPDYIEFTVPFVLRTAAGVPVEGWGDTTYLVTTRLSGLTTLSDGYECSNNQDSCFGFVTIEEQQNVLAAQFKVRAVPEPSTLAIFGLGILGFGLSRRKKA